MLRRRGYLRLAPRRRWLEPSLRPVRDGDLACRPLYQAPSQNRPSCSRPLRNVESDYRDQTATPMSEIWVLAVLRNQSGPVLVSLLFVRRGVLIELFFELRVREHEQLT